MARTMKGKRGKTGRKASSEQAPRELPVSAQKFLGSLDAGWRRFGNHTTTMMLTDQVDLASTAGGAIADVYGNSPTGSPNWADTNTVWGEFRVLGMKVRFYPNNRYSKTTTTCVPLVVCVDRRVSTALASYDAGVSREAHRLLSLEDPWTEQVLMDGSEEAQFQAVSGPVSVSWIKLYATGLTVSTTYGKVFVDYLVQFRNVE